jgi:hypothetical protein
LPFKKNKKKSSDKFASLANATSQTIILRVRKKKKKKQKQKQKVSSMPLSYGGKEKGKIKNKK